MPYKLYRNSKRQWCVRNSETGEGKGCSASRKQAVKHMRLLYYVEGGGKPRKKEVDELIEKAIADYEAEFPDDPIEDEEEKEASVDPYLPTSFAELEDLEDAAETENELAQLAEMFQRLAGNISMHPALEDKATALRALVDEYDTRLKACATHRYEEKAVWTTAYVNNLPNSAFLFVEPGDKDGEGKTVPRSKRHFPYKNADGSIDLPHLRNAIARIPQSNAPGLSPEKKRSLQNRARNLLSRNQKGILERAKDALKELIGISPEVLPSDSGMMIWKEADGQYRWIASYSNNFRDNDNPPEIISADSHRAFVEKVDKGLLPLPELWLWHVKEYAIGKAQWVAYDDSTDVGFALAGGIIYPHAADIAEQMSNLDSKELAVSHGMPVSSIRRDEGDPTIIVEHQTVEISPLPRYAAANKFTGFHIIQQENDMAIPKEKRAKLVEEWGLSETTLTRLEEMDAAEASKAIAAGIQSKETQPDPEPEPVPVEEEPDEDDTGPLSPLPEQEAVVEPVVEDGPIVEEEVEPAPVASQGETFESTFTAVMEPLVQTIAVLQEQVAALAKQVKELKESDEAKIAKAASGVPVASLAALIAGRAVGASETQIDGRTTLAKDKPKETASAGASRTGLPFLDRMLTGQD